MTAGIKHDGGKTRYELLPPEFLEGTAQILTSGAKKYHDHNWAKGLLYSRVFGALMRHLWKWWWGENLDDESGKSHLWHASCELAFLIAFEARGMTHLDDRYKQEVFDGETGNDVLLSSASATATEAVPAQDVQPVRERSVGLLV